MEDEMEQQYGFLRVAILLTKILSYLAAGLGVVGALIILFGKMQGNGKLASIGVLFSGLVYFLGLYLLSDLIRLFLSVEERIGRIETNLKATKREIS
jgi:hypothetical protein